MDLPIFARCNVIQDVAGDVLVVGPEPAFGVFADLVQVPDELQVQHASSVAAIELHPLSRDLRLTSTGISIKVRVPGF